VSHFHLAWYQVENIIVYPKYQCARTATENTENRFIPFISSRIQIIFSYPIITMALQQNTPHLTREQYRAGYMQFLKSEQQNEARNLGANMQYNSTGESLQSLQNMSSTLSGMGRETVLAVLTARFSGKVQNIRGALQQLAPNQLNFAYVASDLIMEQLKAQFGDDLAKRPVPSELFRAIVSGLFTGANTGSVDMNVTRSGPNGSAQQQQIPNTPGANGSDFR